jgi:hypothetical protein
MIDSASRTCLAERLDTQEADEGIVTMQRLMQRQAMAVADAARAHAAYSGLVGIGSWSIRFCFTAPTTDHKANGPGRSEVIPW